MVVTSIRIDKYEPKELGTCAECSVILDDSLCIHKILVVMGEKGEFVAFPNTGSIKTYRNKKRYADIVHPINKTLTENITSQVLEAYRKHKAI